MRLLDYILYEDLMAEKDKEEKVRSEELIDQEKAIEDHTQNILNIKAENRAKAQKREEEALEELREMGWKD